MSNPVKAGGESRRRGIGGLIVNRTTQLKLAVACSTLILLPSLVVTLTLLGDLGADAITLGQNTPAGMELANVMVEKLFRAGLIIVGVFVVFSAASILLSLKLSNHIVGPVGRLESQVKRMIDGDYAHRGELRKGDYLITLGELLNELAAKLRGRS